MWDSLIDRPTSRKPGAMWGTRRSGRQIVAPRVSAGYAPPKTTESRRDDTKLAPNRAVPYGTRNIKSHSHPGLTPGATLFRLLPRARLVLTGYFNAPNDIIPFLPWARCPGLTITILPRVPRGPQELDAGAGCRKMAADVGA